jgi:3-hydroxyisobutyrate dehydrogenase
MPPASFPHRVGWIGVGRMGHAIASRLLDAGVELSVYNRTRSKALPLADLGARVVSWVVVRACRAHCGLQARRRCARARGW